MRMRYGADPVADMQDQLAWGGRLNAYGALTVDTVAPHATLTEASDVTGPGVDGGVDHGALHATITALQVLASMRRTSW